MFASVHHRLFAALLSLAVLLGGSAAAAPLLGCRPELTRGCPCPERLDVYDRLARACCCGPTVETATPVPFEGLDVRFASPAATPPAWLAVTEPADAPSVALATGPSLVHGPSIWLRTRVLLI